MELRPVPRRTSMNGRLWVAVAAVSVVSVLLLVVLPAVLGLQRYVVSSDAMSGSLDRGTLILAQRVPVSDLAAGDVISFTPPAPYAADGMVTRRVVSAGPNGVTTKADRTGRTDPWTMPTATQGVSRMVLHVPWIGYPFLGPVGRSSWVLLVVLPVVVVTLVVVRERRGRRQDRADDLVAPAAEIAVRSAVPR